jgi:hypothetical protein
VSYNAIAVKIFKDTSSLVRFGKKSSTLVKPLQRTTYNAGVVVNSGANPTTS